MAYHRPDVTAEAITALLQRGYTKTEAAEILGISSSTLWNKMRAPQIAPPRAAYGLRATGYEEVHASDCKCGDCRALRNERARIRGWRRSGISSKSAAMARLGRHRQNHTKSKLEP